VLQPVLDDPETGEVVVVVDGSHDGSFELLAAMSATDPRVRPIFQKNAGDGAARKRGIEEARLDVVVVLDDDVIAAPGLIGAHARHHEVDDGSEGPVGRVVLGYMPTDVPNPRRPGQVATILYAAEYESQCRLYDDDPASILRDFWMGNFSMPRQGAVAVGLNAELDLGRHADRDFGLRCRAAGFEAVFDRSLLAAHSHRRTLRQFAAENRRSGADRVKMRRAYPGLALDEAAGDGGPEGRPGGERVVRRLVGSPFLRPLCTPLAMAACFVAGQLRLWRLETVAARVLRRIEMSYGARSV
jgi:glycosyltransferase involved in cell wall biosynthesis